MLVRVMFSTKLPQQHAPCHCWQGHTPRDHRCGCWKGSYVDRWAACVSRVLAVSAAAAAAAPQHEASAAPAAPVGTSSRRAERGVAGSTLPEMLQQVWLHRLGNLWQGVAAVCQKLAGALVTTYQCTSCSMEA